MIINTVSSFKTNKTTAFKSQKYTANHSVSNNCNVNCYPKSYYLNQISFKKQYRANELIAHIGEENFPSYEIVEKLKQMGSYKYFSIYDVHMEHYKDLLNCSTLNEAKEKYPEFRNVIDAKDIDTETLDNRNILKKIAQNKIKDIDIQNFSLNLIKNYYAKLYSIKKQTKYYNLSDRNIKKIFSMLNIKEFNKKYSSIIYYRTPEYISKKSQQMIETWQKDDGTRREEYRKNILRFQTPESIAKRNKSNQTEEYRKRKSELKSKFYANNKKYSEAQRLAWKRHPEITEKMSEIAKRYPGYRQILEKQKNGKTLTENEYHILLAFHKECETKIPGRHKIIGQEYHNILVEWGLKEE